MTETRIAHVGNVGVPVSDQSRSIQFYVETLGFEKRMDVPFGEGYRWIEVAPAGTDTAIALLPPHEGSKTGIDTAIRLMTKDAEADHKHLKAKGIDVDQDVMRRGGGVPPMFSFRGPDGNTLYIVEQP